ncbi:hypothetical protein K456DRAFT_1761955 [Colletotrichum gloeosporioides 23]|nr:hypothetical protein K456DRAFT_1761955 [Colletotrichum gloeosporioides 23]
MAPMCRDPERCLSRGLALRAAVQTRPSQLEKKPLHDRLRYAEVYLISRIWMRSLTVVAPPARGFPVLQSFPPGTQGQASSSVGSKVPTGSNSKCETEVFQWDRGVGVAVLPFGASTGLWSRFSACAGKIQHGDSGGVNGHRKKNDGKDSRGPRNASAVADRGLAHRGGQWDNRRGSCGPAFVWRGCSQPIRDKAQLLGVVRAGSADTPCGCCYPGGATAGSLGNRARRPEANQPVNVDADVAGSDGKLVRKPVCSQRGPVGLLRHMLPHRASEEKDKRDRLTDCQQWCCSAAVVSAHRWASQRWVWLDTGGLQAKQGLHCHGRLPATCHIAICCFRLGPYLVSNEDSVVEQTLPPDR